MKENDMKGMKEKSQVDENSRSENDILNELNEKMKKEELRKRLAGRAAEYFMFMDD